MIVQVFHSTNPGGKPIHARGTAASRKTIPYQGPAEDQLVQAWSSFWRVVRNYLRSDEFLAKLTAALPDIDAATTLITSYVDHALAAYAFTFADAITRSSTTIAKAAASSAAENIDPSSLFSSIVTPNPVAALQYLQDLIEHPGQVASDFFVNPTESSIEYTHLTEKPDEIISPRRRRDMRPASPVPPANLGRRLSARLRTARAKLTSPLKIQPAIFPNPPEFSYADAYQIAAAQHLTNNLVTYISDTTRATLRDTIANSIRTGTPVDLLAKQVANHVGLHPRWQRAVDNLYANMVRNKTPQAIADRRAADYADELIDKRGMMIARTELLRAENTGRLAGYNAMADSPATPWNRTDLIKRWVGAPDPCPECMDLADPRATGQLDQGVTVLGLDSPFPTVYGDVLTPPLHPHCQCTFVVETEANKVAEISYPTTLPDESDTLGP